MTKLQIPYVDRLLPVEIPERNLIFDVEPLAVSPAADFTGTLRRALTEPIGTPPAGRSVASRPARGHHCR